MAGVSPELASLMKKGKSAIAAHFKTAFAEDKLLNELLNTVFNPEKAIDDYENLEWYRFLIAGGKKFDDYANLVRIYDNATTCGLVWTANFVAYRCRTCGITPCMSLCSKCFQAGNHEGHDYNMFRSKAGGACDCGDASVMNPAGFCSRHLPGPNRYQLVPPREVMALPELVMPRLFIRLIYHLREFAKVEAADISQIAMQDADSYLTFLHSLCEMGAVMMKQMGKTLTDSVIYEKFTQSEGCYHSESQKNYLQAVKEMTYPPSFDIFSNKIYLDQKLVHTTILDELVFWMVKLELPQKIVTLLLSLLPDDHYKQAFTKAFVQHYSRVSLVVVKSKDHYAVAHRVVHISVQLFSNETLARTMCKDYNLLYILVFSLRHMVESVFMQSTLQNNFNNYHNVVDCDSKAMKDHCYWPIVSDLINLLSHHTIALQFMENVNLVNTWLCLLVYFQGCNLNERELTQHVEFEPDTYYAAFSAELEISASPMSYLISHCKDSKTAHCTKAIVAACLETLEDWFESINFDANKGDKTSYLQLAFHLPLHRYLAVFLAYAVQHQAVPITQMLPFYSKLKNLLMFPLRIQAGIAEINANLWLRNGLQIKGQAMTYVQCHFCYSMLDADLYLIQVCAAHLPPNEFVRIVIESFHLTNWLLLCPKPIKIGCVLESEQELALVESALSFLAMLQSVRTYLGLSEKELVRVEMVALLCVNDRTHSQLMDSMPEKSGLAVHEKYYFESTLKTVADYKAPVLESGGGLQQGTYVPKGFLWDQEFDPIQVSTRAVYKRDIQSAMDRYHAYLKQTGKYTGKSPPWPPIKIPGKILPAYDGLRRMLHCRTLHGFIFSVLYKAMKETHISETILYFCVFLLELGTRFPATEIQEYRCKKQVKDGDYENWFPTDCLQTNAAHRIQEILISDSPNPEKDHSPSMSFVANIFSKDFGAASKLFTTTNPNCSNSSNNLEDEASGQMHVNCDSKDEVEEKDDNCRRVIVKESLISLLMKLHCKLSAKKQPSYMPTSMRKCSERPSAEPSNPSVNCGDGPYYIGLLLDRLASQDYSCLQETERIYHETKPKVREKQQPQERGTATSEDLEKEERRKKARERRQKLMAEFASKQKAFMEQAMDMDDIGEDVQDNGEQSVLEDGFHCAICSQTMPSTSERPFGIVVLLLSTSVLGHCPSQEQRRHLPVGKLKFKSVPLSCADIRKQHLNLLMKYYSETPVSKSANIGWEGGVLVQSCGHYLHLDCHKQYLESLKGPYLQQTLAVNDGEYWCPVCRQLANAVIPIIPNDRKPTPIPAPTDSNNLQKMAQDIEQLLQQQPQVNLFLAQKCSLIDELTSATHPMYRKYCEDSSANIWLFTCSIVRTNLELELLGYGGQLFTRESPSSKPKVFMPLFRMLSYTCKTLPPVPQTDLWKLITGVAVIGDSSSSFSNVPGQVPILLRDPVALLLNFLLQLPEVSKQHFSYVVNSLYNMAYIQALVVTSLKLTSNERVAWCKKRMSDSLQEVSGMMSHVITRLQLSQLYDEKDQQLGCISQWIWSPDSVESVLQSYLLPYLRIAALLQRHLFDEEFPQKKCPSEFTYLCRYLMLGGKSCDSQPSASVDTQSGLSIPRKVEETQRTEHFVRFCVPEILPITRFWLQELATAIDGPPSLKSQYLLPSSFFFHPPRLVELPDQYYKIFQEYRNKTCMICNKIPRDPTICLICAEFLCFREACCEHESVRECVQHSITCGAGTGVFLLVNSSIVVVIRGQRAALWGSVYLDKHGEEDEELRRGKPLYLSEERYQLLEQQWRTHNFDHACKQWIWHKNNL
ncbi:E3 ubiquitin-protein ligase UBR3 [Octopus bimaculoides]|uniref:E3 ubiquitin-protein ligase n=1 Tax=Octopus bimaculoides TaxID=37653 RepID=A0A0L8IE30_OCTBM|nr:E3 ubiquitin-protein ligase UBR3 [Octopus bimaculoides]|eukprot:XP_014773171.1 PREDICTED: E3 ubiquitin-protein ligase UBR3-like [Octopus bimaculoides]